MIGTPNRNQAPLNGGFKDLSRRLLQTVEALGLLLLIALFSVPFLWMLSTALRTGNSALSFPPQILPDPPVFTNFTAVWERYHLPRYFFNSVVVAVLIVAGQILFIVPAAYAFAVRRFRGSGPLFALVLFALVIPTEVTFVPTYLLFSKLGWINTFWALTVPFFPSSFGTFLFTQAFKTIPTEIVEAAKIDGASESRIMFRIMIPMIKATFLVFVLFSLIVHWNDYFWVMVMTSTEAVRTIPVAVAAIVNSGEMKNWGHIMAANLILIAPMLATYLALSKQIKNGLAYSGIK